MAGKLNRRYVVGVIARWVPFQVRACVSCKTKTGKEDVKMKLLSTIRLTGGPFLWGRQSASGLEVAIG